jgi:SAM-dependent methyltransferase
MAVYDAGFGPKYDLIAAWVGEGKRILDVGCGAGVFSARLGAHNDVTGVEMSEENYLLAKERVRVRRGDFLELDIDGNFDTVLFADVLEHLHDPASALRKAEQLADEIVICVPNFGCFVVGILKLLGITETETGILDRTHVFIFTKKIIETMISDVGLVIVDHGSPRPVAAPAVYDWLIRIWPEFFGYQFMYRYRVPGRH